jgi:methylmalonyl-CoA mutase N-terminal domain/subunit
MLRFHTQTGGSTLTAQQIDNNVVRVSLQALAAVLGGTQSLHTNGKDEALALPTEASARVALRTQQVIAWETGVADFVDPLGGSWAVERITDELEDAATRLIAEIDGMGGMVAAIEHGFPQREIQSAAYATQLAIERGDQKVIGVNAFSEAEPPARANLLRLDAALEEGQVGRVRALRAGRDDMRVREAIEALQQAATGVDNVMPHIVEAVERRATLGEISHGLRRVFGTYREVPVL